MNTAFSLLPARIAKIRVGLLGGSFNPPHEGHLHISLEALKRLGLDYVIWLVTPQNPLKSLHIKGSLAYRVDLCKKMVTRYPKIMVSAIEANLATNYTSQTITRLKQMHPETSFIWLMGMDNVLGFHKWQQWEKILHMVPIVAFDRNHDIFKALSSKAISKYWSVNTILFADRSINKSERWNIFRLKKNSQSSTNIRSNIANA